MYVHVCWYFVQMTSVLYNNKQTKEKCFSVEGQAVTGCSFFYIKHGWNSFSPSVIQSMTIEVIMVAVV